MLIQCSPLPLYKWPSESAHLLLQLLAAGLAGLNQRLLGAVVLGGLLLGSLEAVSELLHLYTWRVGVYASTKS